MQKVVYSISKVNKDEKLKGVGYLVEGNLLIPSTSQKGNAYIRVFEDVAEKCKAVANSDNEFKGYVTVAYESVQQSDRRYRARHNHRTNENEVEELEAQISQYDFDIDQAKQRNYSYLTPEKIKDYFRKVICGDITADSTREHIIKYFIREIILYDDCLVITYNFTDKNIMKKNTPDDIDEVEKELKRAKNARNDTNSCLYKRPNSPPFQT